jgi:hypothetical protein
LHSFLIGIVLILMIINSLSIFAQNSNSTNLTTNLQRVNITGNETHNDTDVGNASEMTGSIASRHSPTCYKSVGGYWCSWNP